LAFGREKQEKSSNDESGRSPAYPRCWRHLLSLISRRREKDALVAQRVSLATDNAANAEPPSVSPAIMRTRTNAA
jgi:hypothetical protein